MSKFNIIIWLGVKLFIRLKFRNILHLSTQDLAIWLDDNNRAKPLLLDAREEEEYQLSHLQHARLVPRILDNLITRNGVDFSTPIVIYCSFGYRSAKVARNLQSLGYKKVFNLSGSIFQWFNEGRAIYQGNKRVNVIHPHNKFWGNLVRSPKI